MRLASIKLLVFRNHNPSVKGIYPAPDVGMVGNPFYDPDMDDNVDHTILMQFANVSVSVSSSFM
jgi:hypothetical protein